MGTIRIERLEASASSIRCTFDYPRELNGFFFDDTFVTEYDADVSDAPASVLVIPWLANVCPLAWATGVDVEVPSVDGRYLQSLYAIRQTLEEMYPEMIEGSEIRYEEVRKNHVESGGEDNVAMMFSGGIDALDTYYRHRDEEPTLLSIHGFDVDVDDAEAWQEKRARIAAFADDRGLESHVVRANIMSFMDDFMLNAHFRRFLPSDWYAALQQGLGLTGVCAPLAYVKRLDTIYMACSASREYPFRSGNDPRIVNSIGWADTTVQSDGFELTRQEKIDAIADFIRENDITPHTCLRSEVGNCGRCEKCMRTAFGLFLAGLDPNRYDYRFDERCFEYAYEQLTSDGWRWRLNRAKAVMWRDLQDHARRDTSRQAGADEFFDWLAEVDIDRFVDESNSSGYRAYRLTRRLPPSPVVHAARRKVVDAIW